MRISFLAVEVAFVAAGVFVAAAIAVRVVRRLRPAELVCRGCGCTDEHGCPDGCWWYSRRPPLCSRCAADELDELASVA